MTTSSQPTNFSITSSDLDTITITGLDYLNTSTTVTNIGAVGAGQSVYSIGTGLSTGSTITFTNTGSSYTADTFVWKTPEEWVDSFPAWSRIEDMCKQYPGLKVAYENFKTVYQLVKDDYDTPKDEK